MGRSVEDVTRLLEVLVGFYIKDERTGGTMINKDSKPYVDQIDKIEVKNTRIGILRSVFGEDSNPNITPVNKVISEALSVISAEDAELIDPVSISGLSHQLKRSSLHEIIPKYNINNFLPELEDPPVRSIEELHQSGAYHNALELFETIAKAPDDPTNDFEFWRSVAAQESLREQLLYLFAEENLDAIAFPSIQILPPKYEDLHNKKITRDNYPVNTIIASQASCPSISIPA